MSDQQDRLSRRRPWQWPADWVRDENFWRDVATRTLAALIAAFIVWGIGVATGIFTGPHAVDGFLNVLQLMMIAAGIAISVTIIRALRRREPLPLRDDSDGRSFALSRSSSIMALVAELFLLAVMIADFIGRNWFDVRFFL